MDVDRAELEEELLGGPPPPEPSESPNYNDGTGVAIGEVGPSRNAMQNLTSQANKLEVQVEILGKHLRRVLQENMELKSKINVIETALGVRGMTV